MCEVCAIFGAGEHWSDFGRVRNTRLPFEDIRHYRDERRRRIAFINNLLAGFEVTCEDWDGEALQVIARNGRSRIAATLSDLWAAVEALSGRRIDPLAAGPERLL